MPEGRLYFVDAKIGNIQSSRLDGSDRKTHFMTTSEEMKFFGIAVDQMNIYVTSWDHS